MPLRRPGSNTAIRLRAANRNIFVGRVRNAEECLFKRSLRRCELLFKVRQLIGDLL